MGAFVRKLEVYSQTKSLSHKLEVFLAKLEGALDRRQEEFSQTWSLYRKLKVFLPQ